MLGLGTRERLVYGRHCERSEAIQKQGDKLLNCFVENGGGSLLKVQTCLTHNTIADRVRSHRKQKQLALFSAPSASPREPAPTNNQQPTTDNQPRDDLWHL